MTLEDFTEFTDRDDGEETTDAAADAPEPAAENTTAEHSDTGTGTDPESTGVTDPTTRDENPSTDDFATYDVEPTGNDRGLGVVAVS